jgi:hypothetical protein
MTTKKMSPNLRFKLSWRPRKSVSCCVFISSVDTRQLLGGGLEGWGDVKLVISELIEVQVTK